MVLGCFLYTLGMSSFSFHSITLYSIECSVTGILDIQHTSLLDHSLV
jgi:cytochrome c oxidase assembly protein Cox11